MKLEAAASKLRRADPSTGSGQALYDEFLALFGGDKLPAARAETLLANWHLAYRAGQSSTDELIHPARRTIYERGFRALLQADRAADGLWLMLATWNACMQNVPRDSALAEGWADFLAGLGLADPDDYDARVQQAVGYVTLIDEIVEGWAAANGA
jgi:hypothetical protein